MPGAFRRKAGSANGIRTRVTAVRGRCPRPLDDSAGEPCVPKATFPFDQKGRPCHFRMVEWLEQARLACFWEFFQAERFEQDESDKLRAVEKIAPPEAPRFMPQAEEPFQA